MKAWIATIPLACALPAAATAQDVVAEQDLVAENARVAELACKLGDLCGDLATEEEARDKDVIEGVETRGKIPTLADLKKAGKGQSRAVREPLGLKGPVKLTRSRTIQSRDSGLAGDRGAASVPTALAARAPLFVTFGLSSASLTADSAREIGDFAKALDLIALSGQTKRFRIEGHADATGDAKFNRKLSEDRASAVRMALIAAGIDPARIEVAGFGADRPVEGYDKANSINRRVEAVEIK